MGMGKTGIPWVPRDSHGNGSKISHGMGIGIKCMGMGVKFQMGMGMNSLKWEGIGTKNLFPHTSNLAYAASATTSVRSERVRRSGH